jgi:hypothetical protein
MDCNEVFAKHVKVSSPQFNFPFTFYQTIEGRFKNKWKSFNELGENKND